MDIMSLGRGEWGRSGAAGSGVADRRCHAAMLTILYRAVIILDTLLLVLGKSLFTFLIYSNSNL